MDARIAISSKEVEEIIRQHVISIMPGFCNGKEITVSSDSYSTLTARVDITDGKGDA